MGACSQQLDSLVGDLNTLVVRQPPGYPPTHWRRRRNRKTRSQRLRQWRCGTEQTPQPRREARTSRHPAPGTQADDNRLWRHQSASPRRGSGRHRNRRDHPRRGPPNHRAPSHPDSHPPGPPPPWFTQWTWSQLARHASTPAMPNCPPPIAAPSTVTRQVHPPLSMLPASQYGMGGGGEGPNNLASHTHQRAAAAKALQPPAIGVGGKNPQDAQVDPPPQDVPREWRLQTTNPPQPSQHESEDYTPSHRSHRRRRRRAKEERKLQRWYRANKKRCMRTLLWEKSRRCKMPPSTLTQHFTRPATSLSDEVPGWLTDRDPATTSVMPSPTPSRRTKWRRS